MTSSKSDQEQAKPLRGADKMIQNKCIMCAKQKRVTSKKHWSGYKTRVVGYKATEITIQTPFRCEHGNSKFAQNLTVYIDVLWRNESFFWNVELYKFSMDGSIHYEHPNFVGRLLCWD